MGEFAEFETNLRRERQLEGIAAAKVRGVYRGRKPSVTPTEVQRLRTEEKLGVAEIARRLGVGRTTVYRPWPTVGNGRKAIPADSLLQLLSLPPVELPPAF